MIIDELVAFSNKYGADPALVLAGGGNTSAKDGDIMYVKGSGTSLATITAEDFVKMNRAALADMLDKNYPENDAEREAVALADLMAAREPGETKRPSVETTLHALFCQRYVLHLHPALVNGLTCGRDGERLCRELFGDDALWIGICKPGYILAKLCFGKMREYKERAGGDAAIVILQNHGIFFADNTVGGLGDKLDRVMVALSAKVERQPDFTPVAASADGYEQAVKNALGDVSVINDFGRDAVKFSASRGAAEVLLKPFTPDHIVYCKAYPLYSEAAETLGAEIADFKAKNGYAPRIIIVRGGGFIAVGDTGKQAATARMLFNDAIKIAVYSESFGGALHMTDDMTDFIVNWEVESYRSKQS